MINYDRISKKLAILADAAKYDVSCSSSGGNRKNSGGLGDSSKSGICHSYTEDGRCVSLLKILLTNHCIYDCAYCTSRRSNDTERAAFTVEEVVDLTMEFYRRNYIEGLFLSSGIFKNPDYTMERLVRVAKELRLTHRFHGYIHLKTIPGASDELMKEAGLYADRLSVNMEIPTISGLALLAPEKNHDDMKAPMQTVQTQIAVLKTAKKPTSTPQNSCQQVNRPSLSSVHRMKTTIRSSAYRAIFISNMILSGCIIQAMCRCLRTVVCRPKIRQCRLCVKIVFTKPTG